MITTGGKVLTLVNPAYMTRMVHELGAKEYGLRGHITSLKPIRPENAPDAWEQKALHRFESGEREFWEPQRLDGRPMLRYMGAFLVTAGCLKCHATQGYHVGDVRGGISVTVPIGDSGFSSTRRHEVVTAGLLVTIWLLGWVGIVITARKGAGLARERQQTLGELDDSRRLYRSLVDALPMKISRMDREGKVTFANEAMLQDLHEGAEATQARTLEREERLEWERKQVLGGETLHMIDEEVDPKTGQVRDLEVLRLPVRGPTGEVIGLQTVSWDVTERVRAERDQLNSAEQYRTILQTTQDGFWLVDASGRILDVNEAYLRMIGHPREEVLGKRISDFAVKDPPEGVDVHIRRILLAGGERFESRHRAKDGHLIEVEVAVTVMSETQTLICFIRDITERKRAEEALVVKDRAIESALTAMAMADLEGRLTYVNAAFLALFGMGAAGEAIGRKVTDFAQSPVAAFQVVSSLLSGGAWMGDLTGVRGDGTTFVAKVTGSLVKDPEGQPICLMASFVDLTDINLAEGERRHLEMELHHLQRLESLGRLAGGVAHDMNNVLAAIMALANVLEMKHASDAEICKAAGTILHAAGRGRDLVKGLTEFARKDLQEAAVLDLNALVRKDAELLERTTLQKVELVLDLEEPLPPVFGEAGALANVLMNVCVNALDAMPGGGRLTLATRGLPGSMVELSITDTGMGMPPEVQARALEPFFTTKPAGKGTGLGLAMAYGTMKAHGGSIDLQSEPGKGTCIRLRLPVLDTNEGGQADAEPDLEQIQRPLRVLLVDDDELIQSTVTPMLEWMGHRVYGASGGLEAVRRLEAGLEIDLVILDLNMPGMTGTETLGRIRLLRPTLPVLVATGYKDEATEAALARNRRVALVMKPFTAKELRKALRAISG